jgi:hypothetical protein
VGKARESIVQRDFVQEREILMAFTKEQIRKGQDTRKRNAANRKSVYVGESPYRARNSLDGRNWQIEKKIDNEWSPVKPEINSGDPITAIRLLSRRLTLPKGEVTIEQWMTQIEAARAEVANGLVELAMMRIG